MSRSASPLSSVNGETSDVSDHEAAESFSFRPSKRQKVGEDSATSSTAVHEPEADVDAHADPDNDPLDGMSDVSEDTEGDIPSSPISARFDEDDFQEQVTLCQWDGCSEPDFHNMDTLVKHIHDDHIDTRQRKYTCEWNGCNRKSMAHASGYALKAHMRSHTREKPFYCYLPGMYTSSPGTDESPFYCALVLTSCRMRQGFHAIRCSRQAHAHRPRNRGSPTL
jgi:hypothetical protein